MDLLNLYRSLNESFPKKLYFHLGVNAGFFSEFNNMLLAVLYCLSEGIQFVLYSADANFRIHEGWRDFFEPFCPETLDEFHHLNNRRWIKVYQPLRKARSFMDKRRLGIDYLTHDIWRRFKTERFSTRRFRIPQLGIEGGILDATRALHSILWRYNDLTKRAVEACRSEVRLPSRYIGLHVRGGDKVIEHDLYSAERYVEKAEALSAIRDAFVLTDDYSIFEKLRDGHPGWRFATTCMPEEKGYIHAEYQVLDAEAKAAQLRRLFAAMDILADSELFVGTFSSNPGMNMGMRMPTGAAHGVDFDSWKIYW